MCVLTYTVVATGPHWSGVAHVAALNPENAARRFSSAMPSCAVIAVFDGACIPAGGELGKVFKL